VSRFRHERSEEAGAILVIVAIALVVLVGITAVAVDGSFGFVQNRRAQNAADFAAFAASQQLSSSAYCNGTRTPSMAQITGIIQQMVDDNDSGIGTNWKAKFLYANGQVIPGSAFTHNSAPASTPPPGACGVTVSANPTWPTFFAGILGIHQLSGYAQSSVANAPKGKPVGIVALNKVGPHEILGGGTGSFVVSGDIVVNTDVTNQPWTGPADGWEWDDAIDAKTDSNLYVYGTIHTIAGTYNNEPLWPLDTCFQGSGILGQGNPGTPLPAYETGDPGVQLPSHQPVCTEGTVNVDYDAIDPTVTQIDDPLSGPGAPPNPLSSTTNIACPGMSTQVYNSVAPNATALLPGEYTNPVELTGSATFEDCSGYSNEAAYPGVYRFDKGLWINPGPGDTVTGSNVVIATEAPYPMAGNVPGSVSGGTFTPSGSGNGAPCLPAGTLTSLPSGRGTHQAETSSTACSGTSPTTYGVVAYGDQSIAPDSSMTGTGNNFSLLIGGASGTQVDLTGPTTGPYAGEDGSPGMVLYQDPTTQANYGFNAEAGDAAIVDINGVVYNASLSNYGSSAPQDYWDGVGGGIPFYAGGTLQTGYGTGWTNGPAQSGGSFQLNGTAIVDDFNTDGDTTITILGQPYTLPGGGSLSLIG
jgi:hypothetical protein